MTKVFALLLVAGVADPPLVGQPADYSHVVGAVTLSAVAAPTTVAVEAPIELQVVIEGQALEPHLPRRERLQLFPPDLADRFFVEPLQEKAADNSWRFSYRLRPKTTQVTHIPGLKLVYFSPRQRRYQAAYSDAIPIKVTPPPAKSVPVEGLKVISAPLSFFELADLSPNASSRFSFEPWTMIGVGMAPPALVVVGLWVWRRYYPSERQLRRRYRSRAAVDTLAKLHGMQPEPVALASGLLEYLRRRVDLPGHEPTPTEVERWLKRCGVGGPLRQRCVRFFEACDGARFGPISRAAVSTPAVDLAALIRDLEEELCLRHVP